MAEIMLLGLRTLERAEGREANSAFLPDLHSAEAVVSAVANMADCVDKGNIQPAW